MFKVIAVLDAAQLEAVMRLPELRGVVVQVEHDAGETIHDQQDEPAIGLFDRAEIRWDEPTGDTIALVEEDPEPKPAPRTIEPGGIERATFGSEGISGPDFAEFQRRMGALMRSEAFHREAFPSFPELDDFEGPMVRARRILMAVCVRGNRFDPAVFNSLFERFVEGKATPAAATRVATWVGKGSFAPPVGVVNVTFNSPEKPQ